MTDELERGPTSPPSFCFIATAAYGTPFAKEIDVLRHFRDNTLLEDKFGEILVRCYYKISPPIAKVIDMSEGTKGLVRRLLDPIVHYLKGE